MNKSEIKQMPEFFDRYINLVENIDLMEAFDKYGKTFIKKEVDQLRALEDKVYAPNKWTVKQLIQHITDTERVFGYRALRFARNDSTELPGYDEDRYAEEDNSQQRTLEEVLEEFYAVRHANVLLYKSFTNEQLKRTGICFNKNISVLAMGFTMCGHLMHHFNVLKTRYYPLLMETT